MDFNNKLYELRKQKGFSQEELANRLNVSRQTISKWEVGDSTPELEKLIAISDLFGISLDELVMNKSPETAAEGEAVRSVGSEIYSDIKDNVFTDDNKKKAKKGIRIAAIIAAAVLAIDIISFAIYIAVNGFPK